MQNLSIKESALDGLDLPIRLKFGHVKRIVLKVPWHHIYVQPTKIEIEGVYLILVPNQGIEYDEEKAKKDEQETKQSSLKRLEQMRDDKRSKCLG